MRIVSLVPSWTETLIWADVNVIGRTRFCIHPLQRCQSIPEVGGTKKVDWQRVQALDPELLILDKEENPIRMAEEAPAPVFATHVESVADVARELTRLAETLGNRKLELLAARWKEILKRRTSQPPLEALPGVVKWVRKPTANCHQLLYLIWKSPWMCVSRNTFVGSMLGRLGYGEYLLQFDAKYPEIVLEDFEMSRTLLLFATEPYPFGRDLEAVGEMGYPSALVDGEKFSWFGLRTLRFLEKNLGA